MAKKLVSELSGAELDYWVASAEGKDAKIENDRCYVAFYEHGKKCFYVYSPTVNPAQGWPIIEREKVSSIFSKKDQIWYSVIDKLPLTQQEGENSLIAAMRCRVASVYGETVGDNNE